MELVQDGQSETVKDQEEEKQNEGLVAPYTDEAEISILGGEGCRNTTGY